MEKFKEQTNETMPTDSSLLSGMFRGRESTEIGYNTMQEQGYSAGDINLVMRDRTFKKHFTGEVKESEKGTKATIGRTLIIPGLGRVVAGTMANRVKGAGFTEERANGYESGIKTGNMVKGVNTRNDEDAKYFEDKSPNNQSEEIHP